MLSQKCIGIILIGSFMVFSAASDSSVSGTAMKIPERSELTNVSIRWLFTKTPSLLLVLFTDS